MSLRVVIVTRIPPVLAGFDAVIREAGHEPVAFLTMRNVDGRYGPPEQTGELVMGAGEEIDVLLPARRATIAPLLASVEPDLVVCMGFPWRIPPDALAVPRLGWLSGHPSLLPLHEARCRSRGRSGRATRKSASRSIAWTPSSTRGRSSRSGGYRSASSSRPTSSTRGRGR